MQTNEMTAADERAKAYLAARGSQACFCGRFKWSGFSFCRCCMRRLPDELQRLLIGPVSADYTEAYFRCRDYLVDAGVKAFEGKLS